MKELFDAQKKYLRLANYISAAQLYLKGNFFLKKRLAKANIKKRLLGHWGTVPGLNFIYLSLNQFIIEHEAETMFVMGPGHGFPSLLSNLFIEGTLGEFYPQYKPNKKNLEKLIRNFSWPGGFPSHANPETPGVILEGGELGYSLSTAFGAAFDNKDLIVACVIGDGEAEAATTAASWHSTKFLNPKTSGAVLPILHLNKFKISGPTIYGTMSDRELRSLFKGYGWEPYFVEGSDIFEEMHRTLERVYRKIRHTQELAREKNIIEKPEWPMIIVKTEKGWTGPKELSGRKIEGTFHSHGIPLENPRGDNEQFKVLNKWLTSYKVNELFDEKGEIIQEIKNLVPKKNLRMGMNRHANNFASEKLKLPEIKNYEVKTEKGFRTSPMIEISKYLRDVFKLNNNNFRIFSPDESESNKLQSIFDATKRNYIWPVPTGSENMSENGKVLEMLSENVLMGWMQGYILTGRHGLFVSYEAFMMIVASMVDQYSKFLKQAKEVTWRKPIPSLNFLLTSTSWRQDHNGFSHQNPGFVSSVLNDHSENVKVHYPPDVNSLLLVMEEAFSVPGNINVIVAGKSMMQQYLTIEHAHRQVSDGIAWWEGTGNHDKDPDIIFAATGDYMSEESIAAIRILKKLMPEMKTRFVNVSELTNFGIGDARRNKKASDELLRKTIMGSKPVIYSYHGFPEDIKSLIFGHPYASLFHIHGYINEGTTTTPFDMQVVNETSRLHLALEAVKIVSETNPKVKEKAHEVESYIGELLIKHRRTISETGEDIDEIVNFDKYF